MNKRYLVLLPFIGAICAYFFMATEGISPQSLRPILVKWQRYAPIIFLTMHTIRPLTFLPTSLLVLLASLYFDFFTGLILNLTGLILGMTLAYFLGNYSGREWLVKKYPKSKDILTKIQSGGWPLIASIRLFPLVPVDILSYTSGVCNIPFISYITGSILGSLPSLLFIMTLGAGVRGGDFIVIIPSGLLFTLLIIWAWKKLKKVY
ncbi:TVP38/TMEM64 family protein [Natranaerobius trueperi]|uniref:TVP38/TMEM64 family membrane protein n=1 Tax=Natranaerobius trueperi TaxID=759412 RepID=A0A226C3A0_9FIRM|nr:VTT domain-containing protein [Natranaerobius trueperi]OWZ84897.1 hypothetical protein CDO51_00375 [Natranaerobius trueperi]